MTPSPETITKIAEILKTDNHFLIVTHVNPDGDAVGSLLGLTNALKAWKKQCWALTAEPIPEIYHFLPGSQTVLTDPSSLDGSPRWIISLDVAAENRIAGDIRRFQRNAPLVNIDHHGTNPLFGALNLVDTRVTSTAELVYTVIKATGLPVSRDSAQCLYTGLVTDTGCFRFEGISSTTFRLAAELVDTGFDPAQITEALFENSPLRKLHLERIILDRCKILLDGKLVMSRLSEADFAQYDAVMSDTENVVNHLRAYRGVVAGVLFTEMADGLIRVSLRSKAPLNVATVASALGGGGHPRAAGIKSSLPFPELRAHIVRLIARELGEPHIE